MFRGSFTATSSDGSMSSDRTMKPQNFVVTRRPRLAEITEHPKMDSADYERSLMSLQGALQLIQQAYLGTSQRAVLVLEGWDTAGKGGIVRRLGWALDPRSGVVVGRPAWALATGPCRLSGGVTRLWG